MKIIEKYKDEMIKGLNEWLKENGYKEVEGNEEVMEDLLDEVLSHFIGNVDDVMDDLDKDGLLGEYEWIVEE